MSAYFVTSTGTDIGKTYVTGQLVRHFIRVGRSVRAYKPVVSGFSDATAAASDPGVLVEAMRAADPNIMIEQIAPWRFTAPLSPDMAAAREGRSVDFDALVTFSRDAIASDVDMRLIEGVGGVMVPLDARHTVRDWMQALNIPVILVAGSYLGTISHTLTAHDVLIHAGLKIAALVISETPDSTVGLDETQASLRNFLDTPIVVLHRAGEAGAQEIAALAGLL